MVFRMSTAAVAGILRSDVENGVPSTIFKETFMEWQTPKACDFRFGFEITMYIAAR